MFWSLSSSRYTVKPRLYPENVSLGLSFLNISKQVEKKKKVVPVLALLLAPNLAAE